MVSEDPAAKIADWPANVQAAVKQSKVTPGMTREQAIGEMRDHPERYDPEIQTAFERAVYSEEGFVPRRLALRELLPGMILGADVKTVSGILFHDVQCRGEKRNSTTDHQGGTQE